MTEQKDKKLHISIYFCIPILNNRMVSKKTNFTI